MDIVVHQGDALDVSADVLVLKHAQALYGVDELAVARLEAAGRLSGIALPAPGSFRLIESRAHVSASHILFVGVVTLRDFDYEAIRDFARRALTALAGALPAASHVALTLHGPGYGLDESEAFRAEVAGLLEALQSGDYPRSLRRITFIERNSARALRLQSQLQSLLPDGLGTLGSRGSPSTGALQAEPLRTAGAQSRGKAHVFVAMPFDPVFDDRFHYAIQKAVHTAGYLCERADLASFTGDVLTWVKARIDSAKLLIADLSTASPNVYLEVGYAWGKGIPTVLLAGDASELRFDVKGQRCLVYGNIRTLEELLTEELRHLH